MKDIFKIAIGILMAGVLAVGVFFMLMYLAQTRYEEIADILRLL